MMLGHFAPIFVLFLIFLERGSFAYLAIIYSSWKLLFKCWEWIKLYYLKGNILIRFTYEYSYIEWLADGKVYDSSNNRKRVSFSVIKAVWAFPRYSYTLVNNQKLKINIKFHYSILHGKYNFLSATAVDCSSKEL